MTGAQWLISSGFAQALSATQWAPTLRSHDPNPPLAIGVPEQEPKTLVFNNYLAVKSSGLSVSERIR